MHYKPTKFDRIRWSYFWENRNFKCFLCKLPLILRVGWKQKISPIYIYFQEDRRYHIWTRLMSWFRPCVSSRKKCLKYIFPVSGIFPGKADSVILLGFQCTINPQNLIKIVKAIFEKFEILVFRLMWTTLNFRGRGKTKKKNDSRYLHEDPIYRIWTRSVNWFRPRVRKSCYWGETPQSPMHYCDVTNPPYLFSGELCTSSLHCKRLFVYTVSCLRVVSASMCSEHVNQTSYWRSGRQ